MLVLPGDKVGDIGVYQSGEHTYLDEDGIYASVVGHREEDSGDGLVCACFCPIRCDPASSNLLSFSSSSLKIDANCLY